MEFWNESWNIKIEIKSFYPLLLTPCKVGLMFSEPLLNTQIIYAQHILVLLLFLKAVFSLILININLNLDTTPGLLRPLILIRVIIVPQVSYVVFWRF